MRWLITGGSGQLGRDLLNALNLRYPESHVWAPSRSEMDLSRASDIESSVFDFQPDLVINCAAWTSVDDAERDPEPAYQVNAQGPKSIASALRRRGIGHLVQVSTDYVFSGLSERPYSEQSPAAPLSVYGASKLQGEDVLSILHERAVVVRTAWLYGSLERGFVGTIMEALESGRQLRVINDQFGHPTWSNDAAHRVIDVSARLGSGNLEGNLFHAVNCGSASWYELATEVAKLVGADPNLIVPISSHDLKRDALRPQRTRLEDRQGTISGLPPMRSWQEALAHYLASRASLTR